MASSDEQQKLQTFLQEIRIVLPGTQVLGAFLVSVPFQARFATLTPFQHGVFLVTFVATMITLALFLAPAVYHRIATPVEDKARFIAMGTKFLVAGFVFLTISTVLSVQLVTSLVIGETGACVVAACTAALLGVAWWLVPKLKLHLRVRPRE